MGTEHQPAPFVVGVGRSGTTLLRLMLDAHPQLAIPPETHFLPKLIEVYDDRGDPSVPDLLAAVKSHAGWRDFGMSDADLEQALAGHAEPGDAIRAFFTAYAASHGKPRWGDKTPKYIESIEQIGSAMGDQARFVHLIRDGRGVAQSRRARAAKRGREPTPAPQEAKTWKRRILGAREQGARVDHYMELRYEDLVNDPEKALRKVCQHIDLDYNPAMLDYHRTAADRLSEFQDIPGKGGKVRAGSERQAAHALTSEPPLPERLDLWKTELGEPSIAAYEEVAGDLLAELGYETH